MESKWWAYHIHETVPLLTILMRHLQLMMHVMMGEDKGSSTLSLTVAGASNKRMYAEKDQHIELTGKPVDQQAVWPSEVKMNDLLLAVGYPLQQ
jgi:hypothetical protein